MLVLTLTSRCPSTYCIDSSAASVLRCPVVSCFHGDGGGGGDDDWVGCGGGGGGGGGEAAGGDNHSVAEVVVVVVVVVVEMVSGGQGELMRFRFVPGGGFNEAGMNDWEKEIRERRATYVRV